MRAAEAKEQESRARRKQGRERSSGGERSGFSISPAVGGGLVMMVIAVIWFVVGLAAGILFYYPPIMFVLGFVGFIRGLFGHSED